LENQISKLKAINTDGVEPMVRISNAEETFLREDEPSNVFEKETVLENGPKSDDDFIRLPKVVKND